MTLQIFLIFILVILILIIILNAIIINVKFNKLIKSDRYKNSNYVIHKYHNDYVLQNKITGKYVCIDKPYSTEYNNFDSTYTNGSKTSVMRAFNQLVPIIF